MTPARIPKREVRYGGAMFDQREIDAVNQALSRPDGLIVGERVVSLESRVAELMGKKRGVMVNSGSSALMVAMRLLNLPRGAEIVTPALTFSTDVASIVHAGYTPAFVDVERDTYQVDIDRLERAITPDTRALLIPNLIGGMPDWDRLRELADERELVLIEDSADTLGGSFRGRPAGERADISITSFSVYHIMTCLGNGGMVCVDDDALWDRALMLRCWGRSSEKFLYGTQTRNSDGRFLEDLGELEYDGMFIFEDLAYGFVPNEAGAAFGLAQLDKLDRFSALRTGLFARHAEFMDRHPEVFIKPRQLDGVVTTWICYPVQLRPELGWSRRELQVHLEDAGIFTRVIFSGNIMRQPMMRGVRYRGDPDDCPNADQIMEHGLMLPCHPTMTDEDSAYLYQALEDFIAARRRRAA